jgi:hypothetical protein
VERQYYEAGLKSGCVLDRAIEAKGRKIMTEKMGGRGKKRKDYKRELLVAEDDIFALIKRQEGPRKYPH